jgi:UDP:flavonoid glycosyltransferase YjiC (YdhE family)
LPDLGDNPIVLVAFSTTFQGQDKALATIIEAARHLPLHAIVTLGNAMEEWHLPSSPNVTIVQGACHDAILKNATATITHGGHGTTMRSLRHGVPLLILPMGRDQNDNAARVEYHGAGLRLPVTASAPDIAQALHRLIAEPGFATNARKIARVLATEGSSSSRLIAEIEAVASTVTAIAHQPCAA